MKHLETLSGRRTKIVATLGPACDDKTILTEMFRYINVARLNFSHGSHEEHLARIKAVRDLNREFGTSVAILADLQGPKIRIGMLDRDYSVGPGDIVTLRTDITEPNAEGHLPMQMESFARDVNPDEVILVEDGKLSFRVIDTDKRCRVRLETIYGGVIKSKKGVNLPMTRISMPSITEKDLRDADFAIAHQAEWIALSFVRTAGDILTLKNYIRARGGNSRVIAKVEKPEALVNIDEIIEVADAVMVARGDLGVEIDLEDVPLWQKRIVERCNRAAKPVIVATQVLDSMEKSPRPTRAEANDVANAVIDGADAVMLSGETSAGQYPLLTVETMSRIISKTEETFDKIYYRNLQVTENDPNPINAHIIVKACELARDTVAGAIVGMTRSGYTAFQLAHCRPKANIFVFTSSKELITTLSLVWGVQTFYYEGDKTIDRTIEEVNAALKRRSFLRSGEIVINSASMPQHAAGLTNMIKISIVP